MKRAIELAPITDRYIELPDPEEPVRRYGGNIYLELVDRMQRTGDFAILVPPRGGGADAASASVAWAADPDPCLIDSVPIPSSRIEARVDELSFTAGSRGERMRYGFGPGFENPYNAGVDEGARNEFPLRKDGPEPGWFGGAFADTGGLREGLELGDEINFDLLWAGATLKRAAYSAALGLDVSFENRFGPSRRRRIVASGSGFFFDLSGHLSYGSADYSAGIILANKTALLRAFERVVKAAARAIGDEVEAMPLVTRLAARCDGAWYIAAGADYRIQPGLRFYDRTSASKVLATVEAVFQKSARVTIDGDASIGDELVSIKSGDPGISPRSGLRSANRDLMSGDLAARKVDAGRVDFGIPVGLSRFVQSALTRLWASLAGLATLPYRVYRYLHYDQDYGGGELWRLDVARATRLAANSWALGAIGAPQAWALAGLGDPSVVVAVIDSGIDYNHDELRRNIFWDGQASTPGWDFVSGDPRPYDDHAHGTGIAGVVAGGGRHLAGAAPLATLLPLKAFSPYGITSSAALYASFEYAVSHGARIIVTGWATSRRSRALEDGVRLALANGLLVVTAAGEGAADLDRVPVYPAALGPRDRGALLVVAAADRQGKLTRASNYGRLVDLAAPGEQVPTTSPRGGYTLASGSGIAAGFAAGAAALSFSRCPKATALDVKNVMVESSQALENKTLWIPSVMDRISQVCK